MIVFDGRAEAARHKERLRQRIKQAKRKLTIYSLVFHEDKPSVLYTALKKKDAQELGVIYEDHHLPISTPVAELHTRIKVAVARNDIDGIIIQKPAAALYPLASWWTDLIAILDPRKDVDGLTGKGAVPPATARAIVEITKIACAQLSLDPSTLRGIVVGRSDIVGRPAAALLQNLGVEVRLFGRNELADRREELKTADLVISATGQEHLIHAQDLKLGVIAIDAGSPKPEIDPVQLDHVAVFHSPVPGGVGPMTRVCLLENLVDMVESPKYS